VRYSYLPLVAPWNLSAVQGFGAGVEIFQFGRSWLLQVHNLPLNASARLLMASELRPAKVSTSASCT